jgi:hypothetical protein
MVVGLDIFVEHFENYKEHYVLIGGSACDWQMEHRGLSFRSTKDIDLILIVEALTDEFVNHFWKFINDGEYTIAEVGDKKQYYRFNKPNSAGYPTMIELFSRRPDIIKVAQGIHLTPIPTGEEAASLSAILLDDDFYRFAIANTQLIDGLHVANDYTLICLKARAFLDNMKRKEEGQFVKTEDITKHRNDIIRLTVTLTPSLKIEVPDLVKRDLIQYIDIIKQEQPSVPQILKGQGVSQITLDEIIEQLENTFGLK